MKPTYLDAGKLAWYPDIACPVCGGDVNSWDKRCSRALGYRQIVCEGCISEEYQVTVENLRYVMENHFGLVPCPGIYMSEHNHNEHIWNWSKKMYVTCLPQYMW